MGETVTHWQQLQTHCLRKIHDYFFQLLDAVLKSSFNLPNIFLPAVKYKFIKSLPKEDNDAGDNIKFEKELSEQTFLTNNGLKTFDWQPLY